MAKIELSKEAKQIIDDYVLLIPRLKQVMIDLKEIKDMAENLPDDQAEEVERRIKDSLEGILTEFDDE